MLRTSQHRLFKLSRASRRLFLRLALAWGTLSVCCIGISTFTNSWIYTSERLKYYVPKNRSLINKPEIGGAKKDYFKNATMGPWLFCWSDRKQSLLLCSA